MWWIVWCWQILDCKNCKCKIRLVDKSVEECTEKIEETRLVEITSAELHSAKNESMHKCRSCTLYIVLFSILFTINVEFVIIFFIFIGT